jgi:hypothetical protein
MLDKVSNTSVRSLAAMKHSHGWRLRPRESRLAKKRTGFGEHYYAHVQPECGFLPHVDLRPSFWLSVNLRRPEGMFCDEKMRLITAYAALTELLAISVAKLRLATNEEFDEALAASETARIECGNARRAVQTHRVAHCC